MTDLPIRFSPFANGPARQTARQIAHAQAYGTVVSASSIAKVEAVAQVTEAALLASAHISALEGMLIGQSPHAEARLRHLADAGTAGLTAIVLETGRRI